MPIDGRSLAERYVGGDPARIVDSDLPETMGGEICLHIKQPKFPQFRFEWHGHVRKVYFIRLGVEPAIGQMIASGINTHGEALNAVWIWLRGFTEGSTPNLFKLAE